MNQKKSNVLVYTGNKKKLYAPLKVTVDDTGGTWLSADQVDFLEFAHNRARNSAGNPLKASKKLVRSVVLPPPECDTYSSNDFDSLIWSTPYITDKIEAGG